MIYKCIKNYNDKFIGEKDHCYAISENSAKELEIDKLSKYFILMSEDEERSYISEQST